MDVPVERLGYTYIVCASGGALAMVDAGSYSSASVTKESLTSDGGTYSRTLTVAGRLVALADPDVARRCGVELRLAVCGTSRLAAVLPMANTHSCTLPPLLIKVLCSALALVCRTVRTAHHAAIYAHVTPHPKTPAQLG